MVNPRVTKYTERDLLTRIIRPVGVIRGSLSVRFPEYMYLFSELKDHVIVELTEEYMINANVPKSDAQAIMRSFRIGGRSMSAGDRFIKNPYHHFTLNQSISGPAGNIRDILFQDFPLFSDLFGELHEDDIGVLTEEYMIHANVSVLDAKEIMRHFTTQLNKKECFHKGIRFSYY